METETFFSILHAALPIVLAIIAAMMIVNFAIGRAMKVIARRTSLTEQDLVPVRHVLRWIVRVIAIVAIAAVLGFEIGGIWAMISAVLGLVAIGFVAVWSILSNLSSTMLILFLRPFHIGDDIEFAGDPIKGRVIDLNFFFTTLVDSDGTLLQVPNNFFFQKALKRKRGNHDISLAAQLNSSDPAPLDHPPKP